MARVSILPSSFTEGGALIDDVNVTVNDARFIMDDYGGKSDAGPVPLFRLGLTVENDGEGEAHDELYSVGGSAKDFNPSEDGKGLEIIGGKSTITKTSKFGIFMISLEEAGFPPSQISVDDVGFLVGQRFHMKRVVVEYKGLKKKNDRDSTVLVVDKLLGEVKGGKKKEGKAAAVDKAVADEAASVLVEIVSNAGGAIPKREILAAAVKLDSVKKSANKQAVISLVAKDTFIKDVGALTYEDGVVALA